MAKEGEGVTSSDSWLISPASTDSQQIFVKNTTQKLLHCNSAISSLINQHVNSICYSMLNN